MKLDTKHNAPILLDTAEECPPPETSANSGTDSELYAIDLMEGHEFEGWCANALRNVGFVDVQVTPGSGDQGVDVLANKDGIKYAIQCKCYSSNLGNTPIQEVCAGKSFYHCHVGVVMTNQYFTPKAKELAEATGTLLWDRDWIISYLSSCPNHTYKGSTYTVPDPMEDHVVMDDMLPSCVDVVLDTGQASVAMLQRRLKLGYARAARIMDLMEELGVVGPYAGSKPRNILITKEQWEVMKLELLHK